MEKAIVHVRTFADDRDQGGTKDIGTFNLTISRGIEQLTSQSGCCSLELIRKEVVTTIINGRRFILDRPSPWETNRAVQFELLLPKEVANGLKFCPHCMGIL